MNRCFAAVLWLLIFLNGRPAAAADDRNTSSDARLLQPQLVTLFYELYGRPCFWLVDDSIHQELREALLGCITAAGQNGLRPEKYHLRLLRQYQDAVALPPARAALADRVFTDAALTLCRDIYQGEDIGRWLNYDGISGGYAQSDRACLLNGLRRVRNGAELSDFVNGLEPMGMNYQFLKRELRDCSADSNRLCVRQLTSSMNYFRWISHFHLDSFIVVNIGSATLRYYVRDTLALGMRAVLGKPDTRTPRFAAYCREVTLYPYWNMPRSIAVHEWLPVFKRNPAMLRFLNMEVIDQTGRVKAPETIDWQHISVQRFPYRIRQRTGCLNPMGVVKFTLTSPFDVYLHDTNFKGPFEAQNRYYSHGCIRIQEPAALANALLVDKVDTAFLSACYRNQPPIVLPIAHPVPVFVVYLTAEVNDDGEVTYYRDIYRLLDERRHDEDQRTR